MDREIIYAIFAAVVGLSIVGGLMFGPKASATAEQEHTYAPEDIRYRLQKSELKKKRKPHVQASAPETLAPSGATSSSSSSSSGGGDGDSNEDSQEEPSLSDEPDAEEPPID